MITQATTQSQVSDQKLLRFLWLEITGKCNLYCVHCYASSSPQGSHGAMTPERWKGVITDAHALGCRSIQFIGGEPTLHPYLQQLIEFASHLSMSIEIYTNLVSIQPRLWSTFQACDVRIATSFYTIYPDVHFAITRAHSFARLVNNIQKAVTMNIPLRVGLIEVPPHDQNIDETEVFLKNLGIQHIGRDKVREVGRGAAYGHVDKPEQALCGKCVKGKACITPDGNIYPCVFARWLPVGNVLQTSLQEALAAPKMAETRDHLTRVFAARHYLDDDELCNPNCVPNLPSNCEPTRPLCVPDFRDDNCNPKYPPCPPDKESCPPEWDS